MSLPGPSVRSLLGLESPCQFLVDILWFSRLRIWVFVWGVTTHQEEATWSEGSEENFTPHMIFGAVGWVESLGLQAGTGGFALGIRVRRRNLHQLFVAISCESEAGYANLMCASFRTRAVLGVTDGS